MIAAAVAVAVPAVAMGQGCYFLLRYRWYFADAPHPVIPSRGVACYNNNNKNKKEDATPLRLLVVGDSLAMGIGMKESATPILPDTVARCLSKRMNRSVEWACFGKPGLTADSLVTETKEFLKQEEQNNDNATATIVENGDTSDEWKEWRRRTTSKRGANNNDKEENDLGNDKYDVIVALVGIADLKAAFLPSFISATTATSEGFGSDLNRFKNLFSPNSIIVLPALPIRPVPIFQYPPLSWFVSPLLSMQEQDKQTLAENSTTNTRVVFIDEPTDQTIQDFEHGRGPLVDMLMMNDDNTSTTTVVQQMIYDTPLTTRLGLEQNMRQFSKGQKSPSKPTRSVGKTLVALDQIHPNDKCYDFWGRHIASKLMDSSSGSFLAQTNKRS